MAPKEVGGDDLRHILTASMRNWQARAGGAAFAPTRTQTSVRLPALAAAIARRASDAARPGRRVVSSHVLTALRTHSDIAARTRNGNHRNTPRSSSTVTRVTRGRQSAAERGGVTRRPSPCNFTTATPCRRLARPDHGRRPSGRFMKERCSRPGVRLSPRRRRSPRELRSHYPGHAHALFGSVV